MKIYEAEGKTAVIAFGRMNPPTIGHAKLAEKIASLPGDPYIFLSHSQKPKTDPLSFEQKAGYAKAFFPNVTVGDPEVRTAIQAFSKISDMGYSNLIYVAGSDRVDDFQKLLSTYNGQPDKEGNVAYNFDNIKVVSAGARDPDAEGAEGMSASKMRAAAGSGDFESFKSGTPDPKLAQAMYRDVRNGLGMMESLARIIEVATMLKSLDEVKPITEYVKKAFGVVVEAWSEKYKRSINCNNPKGFSQRAHCQGRKKNEGVGHKDLLATPKNTVVIDTPGDLDWYKIGQHFPTLDKMDPKEFGQSESDMVITFATDQEKEVFLKLAKRLGLKTMDIGGTGIHPEIHSEGKSPHKKGTKKYKAHMAAMHAGMNESYKLQLERDDDLLVLNILNTETKQRTEVRGKPNYEGDGYDSDDKLHQLLDKIGKAANMSELMNGEVVSINPRHPDGPEAKERVKKVVGEDFNKCFDKACKLYDIAKEKGLKPKLIQVADYKGDGSNADERWKEMPQEFWSHYVTVIDDTVYDPTAKQFGADKPTEYNVSELDKLWGKKYDIRENIKEAGVGRITKQNATKDAPIGSEFANVKKLGLGSGKPKELHAKARKNSDPNTLFNLGLTEGQLNEKGSIGIPLSSGMTVVIAPHRPLKVKKSKKKVKMVGAGEEE